MAQAQFLIPWLIAVAYSSPAGMLYGAIQTSMPSLCKNDRIASAAAWFLVL